MRLDPGFAAKLTFAAMFFATIVVAIPALALEGDYRIHDPSTIIQCDGRYYCFGTGRGIREISSADRLTWRRERSVFQTLPREVASLVPKNNGIDAWAPDVTYMNGEYYLYYAVSSWGSEVSAIGLATSPTLNRDDPKYGWTGRGVVVHSSAGEQRNDIDPCIFQSPDHTLWLTYGSYIGVVEMVQLDPKTGLRIGPDSPIYALSSASEASAMIHHGGFYYLFVNRGSCCQGAKSTYIMDMGRSEKMTGPFLDRDGTDMLQGGGSVFLATDGHQIGPGHFGLLSEDGVDRFSYHLEYDGDHPGRSVLDIRPLLYDAQGWPMPGAEAADGTYQLVCQATGDAARAEGQVGTAVETGRYRGEIRQKWVLTSVGLNRFKILGIASGKALEVAGAGQDAGTQIDVAEYNGTDNQIWKIEQLSDGSYRIVSVKSGLALTGPASEKESGSPLRQSKFDGSDKQKWHLSPP